MRLLITGTRDELETVEKYFEDYKIYYEKTSSIKTSVESDDIVILEDHNFYRPLIKREYTLVMYEGTENDEQNLLKKLGGVKCNLT